MANIKARSSRDLGGERAVRPYGRFDKLKILVVDDHPLFRDGLCYVLRGLGEDIEIAEAESFQEARKLASEDKAFDIVLADLCMPWEDGFTGLRELHRELGDVPLVVISVLEDRGDVLKALECGARGFIPKSSSSDVMLSAVGLVLSGGVYLPPAMIAEGAPAPARRGRTAGDRASKGTGHPISDLTPRQLDVLGLLGEGKSNREIADDLKLAEGTVKVHVTAILRTLGVRNRTQAVLAADALARETAD